MPIKELGPKIRLLLLAAVLIQLHACSNPLESEPRSEPPAETSSIIHSESALAPLKEEIKEARRRLESEIDCNMVSNGLASLAMLVPLSVTEEYWALDLTAAEMRELRAIEQEVEALSIAASVKSMRYLECIGSETAKD
jgi:hypothetical protein